LDFLVAGRIVLEVKAVDVLLPIHHSQLLSYLKLGGWKLGLLSVSFSALRNRQNRRRHRSADFVNFSASRR
jgi:GxxExxY protein